MSWGREVWEELNQLTNLQDRVIEGRFYIATSNRLSASLGQDINGTIENPADSGRLVVLVAVVATINPDRMVVGDAVLNPTTDLPTTVYPAFQPNLAVSSPSQGVFKVDTATNPVGGGTDLNLHIAVHKGRNDIDLPGIIIPPGNTIGLGIPLGALEAGDGTFGVYWYEKDL